MAFQYTFLKSLVSKLGIEDERVCRKASELLRILDLKMSSGGGKNLKMDETSKTVICLDLAATHYGLTCEKEDFIKCSGMKGRLYITNRNIIEKLVGLEETLDVNKICVQCGISEISSFAQTVLDQYMEQNKNANKNDKMYSVVAVYVACRERKIKLQMRRFMEMCNLKKNGFLKLVNDFEKINLLSAGRQKTLNDTSSVGKQDDKNDQQKALKRSSQSSCASEKESYSEWKKRMLEEINESSITTEA